MMTPEFSPPSYTEEHWCIYAASTGEILATETIWTEEGAYDYEPGPSAGVLQRVSTDIEGRPVEIDAIQVEHPPTSNQRVDVSSRTLVEQPTAGVQEGLTPAIPPRP
jgi:hypothetical protein